MIYTFLVDCSGGGPFDGTSQTVVDVDRKYEWIRVTPDTARVPREQEFGQRVYILTGGGQEGMSFALPCEVNYRELETRTGNAILAYGYTITGRDVDVQNRVILCTARFDSPIVVQS